MKTTPETIYLSVQFQLLLTVFLVVLLWFLYFWLRRSDFFRWWAWAWTSFSVYLFSAILSLQQGPTWNPLKTSFIIVLLVAGFLQPVLLILGGVSWHAPRAPSRTWWWTGIAFVLGGTVSCFALGFSWRNDPLMSMALRNSPRTLALTAALLFCCVVFIRHLRKSRSWAAGISGIFCFSYAMDQALYSATFGELVLKRAGIHVGGPIQALASIESLFGSWLLFLDLVNTGGICLGMILLLVEEYQRAERDLNESHRRNVGLVVDKLALQAEIQQRQRVEEALRESERRYRDLVETSEDLLCTHDLEGRLLSANPAPARRLGYEVEELLQMTMPQLLAPQFRDQFPEFIARLLENGQDKGVMSVITRTGEERIWDYHSTLRRDHGSSPVVFGISHDITERVRAEQALRLSETKFATAFRAGPSAMTITSLQDSRFVDVNESFEKLLGYSREEVVGRSAFDLGIWADEEDLAPLWEELQAHNRVEAREVRLRTKSGSLRTARFSVEVIEVGGEKCALAVGEDVTERRLTEIALRESEAKFRLVAETASCCIWILQEGRMVYISPQVESITGYTRDEILQMNPWDLVHPEFRPTLKRRVTSDPNRPELLSHYQYKIVAKSGEEKWLELTDSPLEYKGRPAILVTALDITAAKRAEQEIKEHAMYLDALISNSPLGIVVKDEHMRVSFCNAAFERMFQYSRAELVGKDLDDLIAPHDRDFAAHLTLSSQSGAVVHTMAQRRRKDGSHIDVELHGVRIYSGSIMVGAFAFYQDISERRKSEEKLQALRSRLTRAQEEERARIARDLHDDTGQRLALLGIELEQLKQASLKNEPSLSNQLESLIKMAWEITSDVHHVSRRLHPSQVELLGLVTALTNFTKEFAARNGMQIQFVHSGVHSKPPQDAALCLFLVAQEAIRNAHRHSGSLKARIELAESSGFLNLRVTDEGIGFDPDSREANEGLGLLSMEERLHGMGGRLSVQSCPGGGTCVEAILPLPSLPLQDAISGSKSVQ
jgi:PAS domain S-box-containing protein